MASSSGAISWRTCSAGGVTYRRPLETTPPVAVSTAWIWQSSTQPPAGPPTALRSLGVGWYEPGSMVPRSVIVVS